jgi:hypothetical protein
VVDSVNEKPSPNPPGVAAALPPIPVPTEFEVAEVKATDPETKIGRFHMQPGGRLVAHGTVLRFLINRAFNTNNSEEVAGLPKWADTERFDITAEAPLVGASATRMTMESVAPLMRALLADRFKLTYHTEEREESGSHQPHLMQERRCSAGCCARFAPGDLSGHHDGAICGEIADYLARLELAGSGCYGIEGGWDFTLTFNQNFAMVNRPGRGGEAGQPGVDVPVASEPSGGVTIFDAVEKQLGLKLEKRKRSVPVIVIDHLEQKPTEN